MWNAGIASLVPTGISILFFYIYINNNRPQFHWRGENQFNFGNHILILLLLLLLLLLLFLFLLWLKMANKQFKDLKQCRRLIGPCTLSYECVDPRCENLTNCLQGVYSLTNTIVWVKTIVEIFTPSLFLYCFGNLTTKGWLSQADEQRIYNLLKNGAFKIVEVTYSPCLW